jgi:hypothetical protein
MNTVLIYSLFVSIVVLALYPILRVAISSSKAFAFNRAVLLLGMSAALLTPAVALLVPLENAAVAKDISIDAVAAGNPTPAENVLATTVSTALPFIQLIYFAGIAILLSRTIYAAARISLLIRKSRKETFGGHTLCVHTEKGIAPFSWGRYIVLSDDDRCNAILSHECRHIGARHWIDIAIAECFCIFAWYNPAVWLYKNLVKLNHEFEADAAVISSGIAVSEYQHLLIAKAVGNRAMPLAASFATNSRNFRKRVLLIGADAVSRRRKWVTLCALPAIMAAGAVIASPATAEVLTSITAAGISVTPSSEPAVGQTVAEDEQIQPIDATVLPSPIKEPDLLRNLISVAFSSSDSKLPEKLQIHLNVDEDGQIKSVTTDHDSNPNVRAIIDEAFKEVRFETTRQEGRPVELNLNLSVAVK